MQPWSVSGVCVREGGRERERCVNRVIKDREYMDLREQYRKTNEEKHATIMEEHIEEQR